MKRIIFFLALLLCCAPCGAQQEIYSGVSDQYVYFKMVDATDHVTAETGLSSFTVERSRNGATGTAWTTPTVVEVDATNAPGVYALLFDEDTTITSGDISQNMVLGIAATGCAPTALSVILKRPAVTAGETLTVSSGAIPWSAAWDAEVQSECVDAIASLFQLAGGTVEANVTQVSGDPNAADNAELFFDGTGYAGGTTRLVVEAEAVAIPVNQVTVPAARTWKLQESSTGLVGETTRRAIVGESKIFAIDFGADLPTNGKLTNFDSIAIESGTAGGVTFDTAAADTFGVDKNLAKLEITAVTAGTYVLEATVSYSSSDGGGTAKARVTLVVAE